MLFWAVMTLGPAPASCKRLANPQSTLGKHLRVALTTHQVGRFLENKHSSCQLEVLWPLVVAEGCNCLITLTIQQLFRSFLRELALGLLTGG